MNDLSIVLETLFIVVIMMLSFGRSDRLCCFFQLVTQIMGAGHYSSHSLAQATRDIELARFEIRRLEQVVEDVESFLEDTELA